MKKNFTGLCTLLLIGLLATSCGGKKTSQEETGSTDSLSAGTQLPAETDSTIFGTSGNFGMSTFSMVTEKGDTLDVTRTAEDGTDGEIYGDLNEGERYAMTTRDNNEALRVLINLTQLETYVKDYKVCNGKLILKDKEGNADTVTIKQLDRTGFKAEGRESYSFGK